jgi:hypothetical protein
MNRIIVWLLLTISATGFTGCKEQHSYCRITFWSKEHKAGAIKITLDNCLITTITPGNKALDCAENAQSCFTVAPGVHTYKAKSESGKWWSGSFVTRTHCTLFELY